MCIINNRVFDFMLILLFSFVFIDLPPDAFEHIVLLLNFLANCLQKVVMMFRSKNGMALMGVVLCLLLIVIGGLHFDSTFDGILR